MQTAKRNVPKIDEIGMGKSFGRMKMLAFLLSF